MTPVNQLLSSLHVVDLTHRLPGPLAGKLLTDMGAKVTKIEDQTFGDPFASNTFDDMDGSFKVWYEEMNKQKQIIKLDFKNDIEAIRQHCQQADLILMGLPPKLQQRFQLDQLDHPHVSIEMKASEQVDKSMHDLNMLADLGYLKRHVQEFGAADIIPPPFFPFAGVMFSQHIINNALAALLTATKEQKRIVVTSTLDTATKNTLSPLHMEQQEYFLHNGRYPCYNIYRLQDGHMAIACLEEKFWQRFCDTFSLDLSPKDRFHDQDSVVKDKIISFFKGKTREYVLNAVGTQDMCVSVF